MYRIFIIEDDTAMAGAMAKHLTAWGHEAKCAESFQNIISEFTEFDPQLVLMDITLPFFNGYHWCSEIRKFSNVPVIFVSSASDSMNIVMAMNMGGDDFISKPFDINVLLAKVQAVLRRTYDLSGKTPVLEHKGAVLNLGAGVLTFADTRLELTRNEFRILETLMENSGRVVTRDALMLRLWEDDCYIEENTLSVNVTRLRKKLDTAGLMDFIKTKVGSGYIIE